MNENNSFEKFATDANPSRHLDYIVTLEGCDTEGFRRISVRYIPDKLIVSRRTFEQYLQTQLAKKDIALEELATTILADVNNELVSRWTQVIAYEDNGHSSQHSVVVEDHQPQWSNTVLLSRLAKL